MIVDNVSPRKTPRDARKWCAVNDVELVFLPTYSSSLYSIGSEFAALRYFAPDGTDHRSRGEQDDAIAAYIRWRDKHPEPKCNVAVDSKIGLPGGWLQLSGGWNDAGSPFDTCRLLVSGCARIDSVCAGYEECRRMDLPTVRMTGRSYTTVPSIRTRGFRGFEVGLPPSSHQRTARMLLVAGAALDQFSQETEGADGVERSCRGGSGCECRLRRRAVRGCGRDRRLQTECQRDRCGSNDFRHETVHVILRGDAMSLHGIKVRTAGQDT
ncbi:hypothetical protein ACIBJI_41715 [Nocardia sp. NPDC050408]|uniref:hypothetical protein n=1 Tax=Nocardia sp. NPDC050408 TaxID=3364319 RepID=UPI00378D27DB